MPSIHLQEIFKMTAKDLGIDINDIDEIRKVYFSYFENYKNEISKGNFVYVKISDICRLIPDKTRVKRMIYKMSNFKLFTNLKNQPFLELFNKLVDLVEKIELLKFNHKIYHVKYSKYQNPRKPINHEKSRVKIFKGGNIGEYIKRSPAHRKRKINVKVIENLSEGWDSENFFLRL